MTDYDRYMNEQWFMRQGEAFRRALNEGVERDQKELGKDALNSVIQETHIRRARKIVDALADTASDEGRRHLMFVISRLYCPVCWRQLEDGEECHCWNDE